MSSAICCGVPVKGRRWPSGSVWACWSFSQLALYAKSNEAGSRPASVAWRLTLAAYSANCAGVPTGKRGLVPMGYQALARRPARRRAAGLSPPVQMGGCGFCTGFGANATLAKRQYLLSYTGLSLVHNFLKERMYSLLTDTRLQQEGAR